MTGRREVFIAVHWITRTGAPWRLLPTNLPPWPTVYQQARRWLAVGYCEALVQDLRLLLRLALGRAGQPSSAIFDARVPLALQFITGSRLKAQAP